MISMTYTKMWRKDVILYKGMYCQIKLNSGAILLGQITSYNPESRIQFIRINREIKLFLTEIIEIIEIDEFQYKLLLLIQDEN